MLNWSNTRPEKTVADHYCSIYLCTQFPSRIQVSQKIFNRGTPGLMKCWCLAPAQVLRYRRCPTTLSMIPNQHPLDRLRFRYSMRWTLSRLSKIVTEWQPLPSFWHAALILLLAAARRLLFQ